MAQPGSISSETMILPFAPRPTWFIWTKELGVGEEIIAGESPLGELAVLVDFREFLRLGNSPTVYYLVQDHFETVKNQPLERIWLVTLLWNLEASASSSKRKPKILV